MSKELNISEFGKNAAYYVDSPTHARGASLQRLVDLLPLQNDWTVLDLATGAGHTALSVAPHVAHVTATDITKEMIPLVQKQVQERGLHNVTVELADAERLPYANGSFHLVTCRIAAHHFSNIPRFVAEATRVLRQNGFLAVVDNIVPPGEVGDFVNRFEKRRDPSHQRCLTLDEWVTTFENAGLAITVVETMGKTIVFNEWAKRHPQMLQEELLQMIRKGSDAVDQFLKSSILPAQTTFRLVEGIIIGQM